LKIKPQDITGIVLSGGRSSRMGENKSLLLFRGKPLIQYAIEAISPLCGKIVISSNDPVYDFTGCETWGDDLPVQAPIIGLFSCMKRSETCWNILISCDMPLVHPGLFTYLSEQTAGYEVVVPVHQEGCVEPLCGLYHQSLLKKLEEAITLQQFGLRKFIDSVGCRRVEIDARQGFYHENMFSNINTREDFDNLQPESP
jgi:molybdenum cofactor guanylyltransferase